MEYSASYHQCCFSFLSESEARLFFPFLVESTVLTGDELLLSTGAMSSLFFIVSGEFDVYHNSGPGNSAHLLARLGRGSLLCEGHVVGKTSPKTTIICSEGAVVLRVGKDEIEKYMSENPIGGVILLKHLLTVSHLRLSRCSARLAHIL